MYGPIQQFSEPAWLRDAMLAGSALAAGKQSDVSQAKSGGYHSAANTPRGGTPSTNGDNSAAALAYVAAARDCARAYFETSLMKDWGFSVSTRPMFHADSGVLCPGRVLSVRDDYGEVIGGYVVGVEHVLSVPGRSAITRIHCTHPRFGALPAAIKSRRNALYA